MYTDLTGKVVIITGASGNLGQALVRAFLAEGSLLALVDHDSMKVTAAFPELSTSPQHLILPSADLTQPDDAEALAEKVSEFFGHIDVLVNTVGGFRSGTPVYTTPVETWDLMQNLNTRSVFLACRAVIPILLKNGSGKIINVAAKSALTGKANMAAYTASKNAVINLTESMAAELRDHNIQVNCILPGTIDTPRNRQDMPKADFSKWVPPEDIASVILFLASQVSRAVVGAAVPVNGRS
jgi:NAD(P)-dependent dehydrogenase (short-subunit alcohol dehydrogenase family)